MPTNNSVHVFYYIKTNPSRTRVTNQAGAARRHVSGYKPSYLLNDVRNTMWTEAVCLLSTPLEALFISSQQFIVLVLSLFHCLVDVEVGEFFTEDFTLAGLK
jgi:hypothetical protein